MNGSKEFVKSIAIKNYISSKEDVIDQGDALFDIWVNNFLCNHFFESLILNSKYK